MAERKATNKYYPPDWDPSKGSVNRHKKSHPLRDRARKIDEGILIIRFEMPFNIWCLKCNNHIGMGVRYNAEKSKVGNYYTTPIYKFRMKCHLCDNHFEIQTDPSKFDYTILSGARKQVRLPETSVEGDEDSNNIVVSEEEAKRKVTDAMFRLEKKIEDKIESDAKLPGLSELKESRSRWEDSFAANQLIRSQFRQRRKTIEKAKEKDRQLLRRTSLRISLLKSNPSDTLMAKEMLGNSKLEKLESLEANRKRQILNAAIVPRVVVKKEATGSSTSRSSQRGSSRTSSLKSRVNSRIKIDPG